MNIVKKNGEFSVTEWARFLAQNGKWQDEYANLWALVSGSSEAIYSQIYERIANFVQNTRDVDACTMRSLASLADEAGQPTLFSYDLTIPPDLERVVSVLSVARSNLLQPGRVLSDATLAQVSASIGASGYAYFGASPASAVVDLSAYQTYCDLAGTTTGAVSANVSSGVVVSDVGYLGAIRATISAVMVSRLANVDVLSTCGVVLPAHQGEDDLWPQLTIRETIAYEKWRDAWSYVGFLDDIWVSGDPTEALVFSAATSAAMVSSATDILTDLCVRASYARDQLKNAARAYSMAGTADGLSRVVKDYVKRSFSSRVGDWRLSPPRTGTEFLSSAIPELSSDAAAQYFAPSLSDMAGMTVDVVEYVDTTEYMNVNTPTPTLTAIAGYVPTTILSTWMDSVGFHQQLVTLQIPQFYDTGAPSVDGGSARFWEAAFRSFLTDASPQLTADAYSFYESRSYDPSALAGISAFLASTDDSQNGTFLPSLWSCYAASGYGFPTMADLTGVPLPQYETTDPGLIPADGWLVKPADMSGVFARFSGTTSGDNPPSNYKNQLYPTQAPAPFLLGLVEKAYGAVTVDSVPLASTFSQLTAELVDPDGRLVNSWKYSAHELLGYNTFYEQSLNLDFDQKEDARVDVDGTWTEAALSAYLTSSAGLSSDSSWTRDMSAHLAHLAPYATQFEDGGFWQDDSELFKLWSSRAAVRHLSGVLPWERDTISQSLASFGVTGSTIAAYDVDGYENHYALFKTSQSPAATGTVWMRQRSHPLCFPAASANIVPVAFAGYGPLAYGSGFTESVVSGVGLSAVEIVRTADGFGVATYYPALGDSTSANPYSGVLRRHDYMDQGIVMSECVAGADTVLSRCYDFLIDGNLFLAVGQASLPDGSSYDAALAFNVESREVKNLNGAYETYFSPMVTESATPSLLALTGGVSGYAGCYHAIDGTLTLVQYLGCDGGTLSFATVPVSAPASSFGTPVTATFVGAPFAPAGDYSGRAFVVAESSDVVSLACVSDDAMNAVLTVDFRKGEASAGKYIMTTFDIP